MTDPRIALSACVTAATRWTPLITRNVVQAAHTSRPIGDRERNLSEAIRCAELLVTELKLQQARLGWRDRTGDAA